MPKVFLHRLLFLSRSTRVFCTFCIKVYAVIETFLFCFVFVLSSLVLRTWKTQLGGDYSF